MDPEIPTEFLGVGDGPGQTAYFRFLFDHFHSEFLCGIEC
jgi:hypothetical protein